MDDMTVPPKWSQSVSIATLWLSAVKLTNPASSMLMHVYFKKPKNMLNKIDSKMVPVTLGFQVPKLMFVQVLIIPYLWSVVPVHCKDFAPSTPS